MQAAIRETREELGLTLEEAQYIGPLDQVQTPPAPDLVVHPFVFVIKDRPKLVLDKTEVQHTHWVNLAQLLKGHTRSDFLFTYGEHEVKLPFVHIGEERLWGLSLRIIDDLLNRIDEGGIGLVRNPAKA
jgi:8-oxo-dGTP pyrophosphatase MutT (NUDIX family)